MDVSSKLNLSKKKEDKFQSLEIDSSPHFKTYCGNQNVFENTIFPVSFSKIFLQAFNEKTNLIFTQRACSFKTLPVVENFCLITTNMGIISSV